MRTIVAEIRGAFGLLTVLPVFGVGRAAPPPLARSVRWFPLVGGVVGLGLWGLDALLGLGLPPLPRSALVLVAAAAVTGALHLDGLADTCDGLLSRAFRERALVVMKDTALGAGGAVGLGMDLATKLALLTVLAPAWRGPALLLMSLAGRQAMTLTVAAFPAARPGSGLGSAVARRVGVWGVVVSLACSTGVAAALFASPATGLAGLDPGPARLAGGLPALHLGLALAAAVLSGQAAAVALTRRFGGATGDVYGAVNEVTEVIFLLVAAWGAR